MKRYSVFLISIFCFLFVKSQVAGNYNVHLEPFTVQGFDGLQSFITAQYNGKWLLIGGRKDGLHQRQPFASFVAADNNTSIFVIDPQSQQTWTASLSGLSAPLQEQLQSVNMEFLQRDKMLYAIGGYGYSTLAGDHVTHNKLTAIKVDSLIEAIQNGNGIASYFRQISDTLFTLTGGQMGRIGDDFYLVGGQVFNGRYNPMGPTHGPGFYQKYSNQIRKFQIEDDGANLSISNVTTTTDITNLHRRDYNMLPQIFAGNVQGFTAFSGVFQPAIDLPYLNSVDIFPSNYAVNNVFTQYLNHYHCAKVGLFDSVNQTMENIFFGGISQYADSMGVLVQDNNVPFTKSITNVKRDIQGNMTETKISEMPDFLGSGAEFLPNQNVELYENEIVKTNLLSGDTILLGHIIGGIKSSQKNIFFVNTGAQSDATNVIYKVYLVRNNLAANEPLAQSKVMSQLQIFPNPSNGKFQLKYWLSMPITYTLRIFDANGRLLKEEKIRNKTAGRQFEIINLDVEAGSYFLNINLGKEQISRKIIVE